jgi:hypothetical protein
MKLKILLDNSLYLDSSDIVFFSKNNEKVGLSKNEIKHRFVFPPAQVEKKAFKLFMRQTMFLIIKVCRSQF